MPLSARAARRAPLLAVALLLAVAGSATAATTWTQISTAPLSGSTSIPELAVVGTTGVVTWEQDTSPSTQSILSDTFQTSVATPVAGAAAGMVATNFAHADSEQALVATPTGLEIAYSAIHTTDTADPLNGLLVEQHQPDGSWSAPVNVATGGAAAASTGVYGPAGPIFADNGSGTISILLNPMAPPSPAVTDLDTQFPPGGDGYAPTLRLDAMGRLWIAWYYSGQTTKGIYLQQLNPATGLPLAPPALAPLSDDIDNNTLVGVALACASTCRVVYGVAPTGTTRDDIVSWAPGEALPTTIASLAGTGVGAGRVLAAAYRADGRLWTAWWNGKTYAYELGDATGAKGTLQDAGSPTPGGDTYALRIAAVGDDLLMVTDHQSATAPYPLHMFVNTVAPPVPVVVLPAPRQQTLQAGPGKTFRIQVQFKVPAVCKPSCSARAELRTRTGRQQYAVTPTAPLPGDGKIVLGTRPSVKLPGGKKVRFYLTISKAELLKSPFTTVGGNRIANTRLRVWLTTSKGQELAIADGRIAVSIARIKSGALPGLAGIL
jgi:hypothetical protein